MKPLSHYTQTTNNKHRLIYLNLIWILFFLLISASMAVAEPQLVKDINPNGSSSVYSLRAGSERLFFFAQTDNNSNTQQLWTSDGTEVGTMQISNIDSDEYTIWYSNKNNLAVNHLYFFTLRRKSDNGYELWRSNGTVSGTFKVIDIPDYLDYAHQAVGAGGVYYFVPWSDSEYGRELWVSDGSTSGTHMVKDINPGAISSSPHNLMAVDDRLFFLVGDNLWVSNGSSVGTQKVTYFEELFYGGILHTINVNDVIYIVYRNNVSELQLWRYDSMSGQNVKVKDFGGISSDAPEFAAVGDELYFIAKEVGAETYDLWKTDGTPQGTVVVKHIGEAIMGSYDWNLTNVNGTLFFRANDKVHGWELWKSDGTASGTFMIKDLKEGVNSSSLYCFVAVGDTLFFAEKQTNYVTNLWMSDGTEAGTVNTDTGVSQLRCPVKFNEQLYFYGSDRSTKDFGSELYRYNLSDSDNVVFAPEINVSTDGVRVNISWSSVANAEGYTLFYAPYPYTGSETIGSIELGNVSGFSADLWSGAAYYVAITSRRSDYMSEYSNVTFFIIGQ